MPQCSSCKFFQQNPTNSDRGFCRGNEIFASYDSRSCPQKSYQKRIDPWHVNPYIQYFDTLRQYVERSFNVKVDDDLYNLHDISHYIRVEKMVKVIVSKGQQDFSALERFILSCAAWTHDLGMNTDVAKSYFADIGIFGDQNWALRHRRDEHHNASSWYVINKYRELFSVEEGNELLLAATRVVSILIQFHRKTEDLSTCEELTTIRGELVRTRLLAAIFRLADTLHKDISRFDPNLYAMLQISSTHRASRLHWLKSYVVSNIHLYEYEQTITVQLSLPDFRQFIDLKDRGDARKVAKIARSWEERIRNLRYVIATDIEEDLMVVNEEFSRAGMPTYVKVNTPITYVRGHGKRYFSDIESVLSELDILFSPNTSKVISRALDALRMHYGRTFESPHKYQSLSDQVRNYLEDIHSDRPCHVGLWKIVSLLKNHDHSTENKKEELMNKFRIITDHRNKAMEKLRAKVESIISVDVKRIILIGYSSTIVNILESLADKRNDQKGKIEIIVLECAPKRRLGHSNIIEYNDGIHYANEIGKIDFYSVKILPDIGLATLLDEEKENNEDLTKSCLVLFGANGIDTTTGDCGHSSGHLAIAIVAEHFGVPVKVIADSFKIGEIKWNRAAERKGGWLVTQKKYIEELRDNYVDMRNLREDRIPVQLIWEIHTEDDSIIFRRSRDKDWDKKELKKFLHEVCPKANEFMNELPQMP